jgi:hypothetical protein
MKIIREYEFRHSTDRTGNHGMLRQERHVGERSEKKIRLFETYNRIAN